jgi:hypothetical protein
MAGAGRAARSPCAGAFSRRYRRVCRPVFRPLLRSALDGMEISDDCTDHHGRRCPRRERHEHDRIRGRAVRGAREPYRTRHQRRRERGGAPRPRRGRGRERADGRRRRPHARLSRYRHHAGLGDRCGAARPARPQSDGSAACGATGALLPRSAQHREQRAASGRHRGAERDWPQPHAARRAGRVWRARRRPGPHHCERRPHDRRRPPRRPLARAAGARRPPPVRRHHPLCHQPCRRVPQSTSFGPISAAVSNAVPESRNRLRTPRPCDRKNPSQDRHRYAASAKRKLQSLLRLVAIPALHAPFPFEDTSPEGSC